jgi:7-carboxy-7-deazaguanine synthase
MSKLLPLAPNGIFWTIQGEGALRGVPMTFIRLAGCSIGCPQCDTDYRVDKRVTVDEILQTVLDLRPAAQRSMRVPHPKWVWITGGEPTDHDLGPLIGGLRSISAAVALATAGTRKTAGLDVSFLSVSPHNLNRLVQTTGTEVKVVLGLNGMTMNSDEAHQLAYGFDYAYVQPLWFDGKEDLHSVQQCVEFVLTNPEWRMTDQGHKRWSLP